MCDLDFTIIIFSFNIGFGFGTKISFFGGSLSNLKAENTTKRRPFKVKTMPKHFVNNSKTTFLKNSRKRNSWPHCKKWSRKTANMTKSLNYNFDFWCHILTFWAKIQPKVGFTSPKTINKVFLHNFLKNSGKVQKTTFWIIAMGRTRVSTRQKVPIFGPLSIYEL